MKESSAGLTKRLPGSPDGSGLGRFALASFKGTVDARRLNVGSDG